jgi:hypothetical protein
MPHASKLFYDSEPGIVAEGVVRDIDTVILRLNPFFLSCSPMGFGKPFEHNTGERLLGFTERVWLVVTP